MILTLKNGKNNEFKIPKGTKFNVDGQPTDAWGLMQLKSNENLLRLQDELAGTENRIAVERKRYKETLQDYDAYIQQFPNYVLGVLGRILAANKLGYCTCRRMQLEVPPKL